MGNWPKKISLQFMSKRVLLMWSSRWFKRSCLTLRPLNHLSLFLYAMWGNVLISLFYMWLSTFPSITCWRHCLFSIVYSWLLCHRLNIGTWIYFCVLLSVPLIGVSVFVPMSHCFDYCGFLVWSDVRESYNSSFVLFSQNCFYIPGSFVVPCKF